MQRNDDSWQTCFPSINIILFSSKSHQFYTFICCKVIVHASAVFAKHSRVPTKGPVNKNFYCEATNVRVKILMPPSRIFHWIQNFPETTKENPQYIFVVGKSLIHVSATSLPILVQQKFYPQNFFWKKKLKFSEVSWKRSAKKSKNIYPKDKKDCQLLFKIEIPICSRYSSLPENAVWANSLKKYSWKCSFRQIQRIFDNRPKKSRQTAERFCSIAKKELKKTLFIDKSLLKRFLSFVDQ